PKTGRTTNSEGVNVDKSGRGNGYANATWADGSGPTGDPPPGPPIAAPEVLVDMPGAPKPKTGPGEGPWNGVAVFDHPQNHGFPARVGKYSVAQQITMVHYPPPEAPNGPFSFQHRVYVHDGDAEAAGVASLAAQYGQPCRVEIV
ncbi:MAG TPA: DUF6807 family protein, partial [Chloroflexota bacterium]|nr:DUF6807 family protein [Chloroflexota bacterium]